MAKTHNSSLRLAEGVRRSFRRLKRYRQHRLSFMREFAGQYYTSDRGAGVSSTGPEPLNTIYNVVSLMLPHLAFQNPKSLVTTDSLNLRPESKKLELALDRLYKEIDLWKTLRISITDALLSVGIVKVGLTSGGQIYEVDGYQHDNGQPFCDAVDLDDYIIDPDARRREEAWFEGNRYKLPLSFLKDSEGYNQKVVDTLRPRDRFTRNQSGEAPVEELSRRSRVDTEEYIDQVDLIDLWLPKENMVVTIAGDINNVQGFVKETSWEGPERGPYEMLGFNWVPNNALPLSPIAVLFDLHVMINKQARKLGRQADRQKDLVLYDKRNEDEAEGIKNASDGEMVGVGNVDRFRQVSMGGVNDKGFQNLQWLEGEFSRNAGNTDLLGGVVAQSDTVGQDQLLMQNASIKIDDMRTQTHRFTQRIAERLAWYLVSDPLIELPMIKEIGGVPVPVTYSAEEREGDFIDFNFDIQPYSMQADTPSRKYQRLQQVMMDVVVPTIQLAAAQGMTLDVQKLTNIAADTTNLPELKEIYSKQQVQMQVDAPIRQGSIETNIRTGAQGGSASPQEQETPSL